MWFSVVCTLIENEYVSSQFERNNSATNCQCVYYVQSFPVVPYFAVVLKCLARLHPGLGDSHIKRLGVPVVSLRGLNQGF